jgi:hypothetical protein
MSKVDYLTEDSLLPSDQKYVCLSFLTDTENKTTLSGIKIRGVFETYDSACAHAKKLQSIDPAFNVFVGETGKWLPFDPNPDSKAVKDSEYANDQLNSMMKSYMENQEKAKVYHEQRKNEMMRQSILDNMDTTRTNLKELKDNYDKEESENEKLSLESKMKTIEEQIKTMENKKKNLDNQISETEAQLKRFSASQMAPPKVLDV